MRHHQDACNRSMQIQERGCLPASRQTETTAPQPGTGVEGAPVRRCGRLGACIQAAVPPASTRNTRKGLTAAVNLRQRTPHTARMCSAGSSCGLRVDDDLRATICCLLCSTICYLLCVNIINQCTTCCVLHELPQTLNRFKEVPHTECCTASSCRSQAVRVTWPEHFEYCRRQLIAAMNTSCGRGSGRPCLHRQRTRQTLHQTVACTRCCRCLDCS